MSTSTKRDVLEKLRRRYRTAGREHKVKLVNQAVELLGYHRKAAIRSLNSSLRTSPQVRAGGRPVEFDPTELLPVLRVVWPAANYPCGKRLAAMLPDWLDGYESYHRSLGPSIRERLLSASARTLDRILAPLRVQGARKSLTKPGSLLRQQIPIRGSVWDENKAGWLEVDTVALCGGSVEGNFIWMVDGVDYSTAWVSLRAIWNRGQEATLQALKDIENTLPFPLLGLDSDNGGEFLNYHVMRWLQQRTDPVFMTRSRPYKKDDNAHVEQKNWTHVRLWFGYERYDNPEVVEPLNELLRGNYSMLLNYFHATMKLERKPRAESGQMKRVYGTPQTPLSRVLMSREVPEEVKKKLKREKEKANPFALKAAVEKQLRNIEKRRRA